IRWIALLGVIVVLLVTSTSAFMRVRAAGLGCANWPACYGPDHAITVEPVPAARLLHRVSATLAGACAAAIAVLALARPRQLRRELLIAVLLLSVTVFLAALGRSTPGAKLPAIALGNVLGGMLMAALFAWVALGPRRGAPTSMGTRLISGSALFVLFVQIALGVLTSASYSSLACPAFPTCTSTATWLPFHLQDFDPWRHLQDFDPWRVAGASPAVHIAHRYGSLAAALAVFLVAWRLGAAYPALRLFLIEVLLAQLALGAFLILGNLPLPLAVAHNLGAALLWLAAVTAHHRLGRALQNEPAEKKI